jgi:hypothetical protein
MIVLAAASRPTQRLEEFPKRREEKSIEYIASTENLKIRSAISMMLIIK